MDKAELPSVSAKVHAVVEAAPDVALLKLHVVGDGTTMVDAVRDADDKVTRVTKALLDASQAIATVEVFDVYLGQKEERLRTEIQTFPRPWVVRGILVQLPPADLPSLHALLDEAVRKGALLASPHGHRYLPDALDSALLFGLVDSKDCEERAIAKCLEATKDQCRTIAATEKKTLGTLLGVAGVSVGPAKGQLFRNDCEHIQQSFPTRYLSPTNDKVLVSVELSAKYALVDKAT